VSLVSACAILLVVAAIAAYLPACRASRVDPARALQAEQRQWCFESSV
jgi:ABC-type lipoprotein release transport system permease subunit